MNYDLLRGERARQLEGDRLLGDGDLLDAHLEALAQEADELLHQDLRRRGTGGDRPALDADEPRPVERARPGQELRLGTAGAAGDLEPPAGSGRGRRADCPGRV